MPDQPLVQKKCGACQGGVPAMKPEQANQLRPQLHPDWLMRDDPGKPAHVLYRRYEFPDFAKAMSFVDASGRLMEAEGHHCPNIQVAFSIVHMLLYTAKADGLTEPDFILAAKMDALPEAAAIIPRT